MNRDILSVESGEIDCEWRHYFIGKLENNELDEQDIYFILDCLVQLKEELE